MTTNFIFYFNEQSSYLIKRKKLIKKVLMAVCSDHNKNLQGLNIVVCNDNYLLKLNEAYLKHTTLTDIITFSYSEVENEILGDIFLSEERANENAKELKIRKEDEVNRLIIHGLLHLCGYNDKTDSQKLTMRKVEDKYLSLLSEIITKSR